MGHMNMAVVTLIGAVGMFFGGLAPIVSELQTSGDFYSFKFAAAVMAQIAAVCSAFVSGQLFRTSPMLRRLREPGRRPPTPFVERRRIDVDE